MTSPSWTKVKRGIDKAFNGCPNYIAKRDDLLEMCKQKFASGAQEHGEGTWESQNPAPMLKAELIDSINYINMWRARGLPDNVADSLTWQITDTWSYLHQVEKKYAK